MGKTRYEGYTLYIPKASGTYNVKIEGIKEGDSVVEVVVVTDKYAFEDFFNIIFLDGEEKERMLAKDIHNIPANSPWILTFGEKVTVKKEGVVVVEVVHVWDGDRNLSIYLKIEGKE